MNTIKIKADVVLVPQRSIVSEEDIESDCTGCVFNNIPSMSYCEAAYNIQNCDNPKFSETMVFILANSNIKEKVL